MLGRSGRSEEARPAAGGRCVRSCINECPRERRGRSEAQMGAQPAQVRHSTRVPSQSLPLRYCTMLLVCARSPQWSPGPTLARAPAGGPHRALSAFRSEPAVRVRLQACTGSEMPPCGLPTYVDRASGAIELVALCVADEGNQDIFPPSGHLVNNQQLLSRHASVVACGANAAAGLSRGSTPTSELHGRSMDPVSGLRH